MEHKKTWRQTEGSWGVVILLFNKKIGIILDKSSPCIQYKIKIETGCKDIFLQLDLCI